MLKSKTILLLTAAGILGATAVAGASGLTQKVSGLLRSDIHVSVNGVAYGSIQPVYIDGKAYVPLRDTAGAMGYEIAWNPQAKQFDLTPKKEEQAPVDPYILNTGVVTEAQTANGLTSLNVMGKGSAGTFDWIVAKVDKDTVIVDASGAAKTAADLKAGSRVAVEYGPIVALSFPGQSHAAKVTLLGERLIKEDKVGAVNKTESGWQIQLGTGTGDAAISNLVLNVGPDALIVTSAGEPIKAEDIKAGAKVRAFYGPSTTKSIPAQSAADTIVVLPADAQ
ncbi:stalk domain-containing protein [Cohnella sp. JJ-181]|uniref:stalk domain-containing protein n=1 Tax=Cohnella rhizoplanae TaxID=2974897 RepID=UPI0022FF85FD|nr:stalk domain-containing protein [Cohnella sp. JJ-181]CAI6081812.1 Protease inhibitor [Cohnella sp. JJ-181]